MAGAVDRVGGRSGQEGVAGLCLGFGPPGGDRDRVDREPLAGRVLRQLDPCVWCRQVVAEIGEEPDRGLAGRVTEPDELLDVVVTADEGRGVPREERLGDLASEGLRV